MFRIAAAITLLLAAPVTAQTMFKCTGADGVTAYQQTPCETEEATADVRHVQRVPDARRAVAPVQIDRGGGETVIVQDHRGAAPHAPSQHASAGLSGMVECVAPDGRVYVRKGECDRRKERQQYAVDPRTGQTYPVLRQPGSGTSDPGRLLDRNEACARARAHERTVRENLRRTIHEIRQAEAVVAEACAR